MLLKEMFSPIGAPKEDLQDIDWIDDLKFYIDNNDDLLTKKLFPAIKRHEQHKGNPQAFKIYIRPLQSCCEDYCRRFEIENPENKFPKEKLIELAKKIAEEQDRHISAGQYKR